MKVRNNGVVNEQNTLRELALFAGAGGGILGGKLLGWQTVCAVEIDPYCAGVLCQRQNDGFLAPFPIWDDIRTFDGRPWRGIIDVISGGFPCQDISAAGRGAGIGGKKSGLWKEMARIIGEVRPRFALVENSPTLTRRGLGVVLGDLSEMGYDAQWGIISAAEAGAPHLRKRIWVVAYARGGRFNIKTKRKMEQSRRTATFSASAFVANSENDRARWWVEQSESSKGQGDVANADGIRRGSGKNKIEQDGEEACERGWWELEPDVGRVANGVAARMDRLKAIGNGQVPSVVKIAWEALARAVFHAETKGAKINDTRRT